jgi:hypothetical protein
LAVEKSKDSICFVLFLCYRQQAKALKNPAKEEETVEHIFLQLFYKTILNITLIIYNKYTKKRRR